MAVHLDHTIVPAYDKRTSAAFLAHILGLQVGPDLSGYFVPVALSGGPTLDFMDAEDFRRHHYAFLVSDQEFDAAHARLVAGGIEYCADPFARRPREISYTADGGRGVYFDDPNQHSMELLTLPDTGDPNEERWAGPYQPASQK